MTAKTRTPERAVRLELKRIRAAHPDLTQHADALAAMERLAGLRCRFRELTGIVEEAGGASEANLATVAELRQLSRAAGVIEKDLRSWWAMHERRADDPFSLLAAARAALIARADSGKTINAQPVADQRPFSAGALIRQERDFDS